MLVYGNIKYNDKDYAKLFYLLQLELINKNIV